MRLVIEQIADRGVPNAERLCLLAHQPATLSYYCVLNTVASGLSKELVIAGARDAFWFPIPTILQPGDRAILYTGPGVQTFAARGANTDYFFYWGKSATLWGDPDARAVLFELSNWMTSDSRSPGASASLADALKLKPAIPPRINP